jgi:hypothetical protein
MNAWSSSATLQFMAWCLIKQRYNFTFTFTLIYTVQYASKATYEGAKNTKGYMCIELLQVKRADINFRHGSVSSSLI